MRTVQEQASLERRFKEQCLVDNGTPMYTFSEIYEHILFHKDGDWNFSIGGADHMTNEDLIRVNWALLKSFTQEQKGEEAEEIDPSIKESQKQKDAYVYCKKLITFQYKSDLGLPEEIMMDWESLDEQESERSSEFDMQMV